MVEERLEVLNEQMFLGRLKKAGRLKRLLSVEDEDGEESCEMT